MTKTVKFEKEINTFCDLMEATGQMEPKLPGKQDFTFADIFAAIRKIKISRPSNLGGALAQPKIMMTPYGV